MSGTDDLRSEHLGVERMLATLDAMSALLHEGGRVDPADLDHAIEFLRVFVDQCHHAKEEEHLFPALRVAGVTTAEKTIEVLLGDHERGRSGVARIAEAAHRLAAGDDIAREELAGALSAYTELLRAHIDREERDCFDLADRELPVEVQDDLVEAYERIEHEVVGDGRHEAFHALLDRMASVYG